MDRKGILIIVVTLAIAIGYQFFVAAPKNAEAIEKFKQERARWEKQQKLKKEAEATAPAAIVPALPGQPAPIAPVAPAVPTVAESKQTVKSQSGTVEYVFTNLGGGISRAVLNDHYEDKARGSRIVLNEFGEIPIGALAETAGKLEEVRQPWIMTVDEVNAVVTFERTDAARQIKTTKRYTLPRKPDENDRRRDRLREEFLIALDITYTNVGPGPMIVPKVYLHAGGNAPIHQKDIRYYQGFDYWKAGTNYFRDVDSFSAGGMLWWARGERPIIEENADDIRWMAVTNQYFTTLITVLGGEGKTEADQRELLGTKIWAKRHYISPDEWRQPTEWRPNGHVITGSARIDHIDVAMGFRDFALTPGQSVTRNYQIYAGPREYRRLRLLDHHESDVLNYGSFLGIPTAWFSKLLLNSMNGLYAWVGHYGIAIILLTLIVKAFLWPLQSKANKSMKRMAELQPQMKALQDKFKDDPQRFQQEMGKMWKKAGVNPLSGCWPIFIQIPIFIGFYNMLDKAVELRHHGFLWVSDLSAPDTVAHLFGLPINPLPLVMAFTMFLQMKLAPQGGDPMQRKIFMFMPLIFVLMCYNFASALALYWTVQNIISIVQLLVNRHKEAKPAPLPAT